MRIMPAALACLVISTTPAMAAKHSSNSDADLSLALAKVSLYAEQNRLDEALQITQELKHRYPNNPQVLAAEADIDFRMGNRGAAFAALNEAHDLDPGNEDILNRQRRSLIEQGPFAGGGYQYRHTSEANEQFIRVDAQAVLSPTLSAQLEAQNDHIHSRTPFVDTRGALRSFSGNRQMGNLTLDKVWHNGDEANASLYGTDDSVGAGAQYSAWDRYGATTIQGNINKPDWDYPIMVIEHGTRDNIRLERRQIITPRFQATLGGGYNRYNLEDESNAGSAAAWDLNLTYTFPVAGSGPVGNELILAPGYNVAAEYFTHEKRETDITGTFLFKPLPISSYEVHTLSLTASKNFSSSFHGDVFGGYSVDRLGGNGPLFGAVLQYSPFEHLGVELHGTRALLGGLNNGSNNEKEDIVGINIKIRW